MGNSALPAVTFRHGFHLHVRLRRLYSHFPEWMNSGQGQIQLLDKNSDSKLSSVLPGPSDILLANKTQAANAYIEDKQRIDRKAHPVFDNARASQNTDACR